MDAKSILILSVLTLAGIGAGTVYHGVKAGVTKTVHVAKKATVTAAKHQK